MAKKSSTLESETLPALHHQQVLAELVPVITSITAEATRNKPGQPTKRTEAIITEICVRLACGEALTMICNDPTMPGYRTVHTWKKNDPELQNRLNTAREDGTYVLDDIAELIARKHPDFATGDFRYDDLLVKVLEHRKRYANRKRFGDKVQVEVTDHRVFVLPDDAINGQGY